jgi:glucose/arabinose dehydrogenase
MKLRIFCAILGLTVSAHAWQEYFSFDKIPNPVGIDPQVGAMDTMKDGRIAVAFHRGEVMIFDPKSQKWSLYASGLQEPLGMLVEDDKNILVMQRAELTRIKDVDGDGSADEYQTVYDDFGMSGNYHEFSYGPARDKEGNLYVALGIASNGAPIREEIRGRFSEIGKANREQMTKQSEWGKNKGKAERMYARVEWRGWVMKLSPDGKKVEPYASGLRSPNGIGFDAKGRLLITDNQGDWRPTSPLYEIKKGGFYGHPASLVWKPDWDGSDPYAMDVKVLDKMQSPPAGYFPEGELANSPTWPVVIPKGAMPDPLVGQTLIGEMNQPVLVRVLDDEVDGVFQTGLTAMFDGSKLGLGNNRIVFGNDGSMYVGKTALSWAGDKGITRIKWNGKPFFAVDKIKAVSGGFSLSFSEDVDAATLSTIAVESNTYNYFKQYGSPKVDKQAMPVVKSEVSNQGRTVRIDLGGLKEGYLHAIDLTGVRSKSGSKVMGGKIWYQVIKAPK